MVAVSDTESFFAFKPWIDMNISSSRLVFIPEADTPYLYLWYLWYLSASLSDLYRSGVEACQSLNSSLASWYTQLQGVSMSHHAVDWHQVYPVTQDDSCRRIWTRGGAERLTERLTSLAGLTTTERLWNGIRQRTWLLRKLTSSVWRKWRG